MFNQMKNVFVSSFNFFVPIHKIGTKKYSMDNGSIHNIGLPAHIQNCHAECRYLKIADKEQELYYLSKDKEENIIELKVKAYPYLISFNPSNNKPDIYFLVIHVLIDKVIETECKHFVSTTDLVALKKAFYENSEKGLFTSPHQVGKQHYHWIKELVCEIENSNREDIQITNSIVNLCGLPLDISTGNASEHIDIDFSNAYYKDISDYKSLEAYLGADDSKFIYGLLFANDNYLNTPIELVDKLLKSSFSNNIYEKTYANLNDIVVIKTHTQYTYSVKEKTKKKYHIPSFHDTQCLYEMCHILYLKQELASIRDNISKSKTSADIKSALSSLAKFLEMKLFHVEEADGKMDYFYKTMGINSSYSALREFAEPLADSINIRNSQKTNDKIKNLTLITMFIGLIQVIQNCQNYRISIMKCWRNIIEYLNHNSWINSVLLILILMGVVLIAYRLYSSRIKHMLNNKH